MTGVLFRCSRLAAPSGQDIGFVGRIDHVNIGVLTHVGSDYIPVIASVGADEEGNSYNINADDAAAAVAAALGAYKAMFLTDVAGWFRDAERSGHARRRGDARPSCARRSPASAAACARSWPPACTRSRAGCRAP